MKLEVAVYKSRRRADTYVYLLADAELDSLPDALREQFGEAEAFLHFELSADRYLAQAEASAVLAALEAQGFYLQLPPQRDQALSDE